MAETTITVNDNGPYVIRGDAIKVLDGDGGELEWRGNAVALCRCGQSENKPFCDGTHNRVGFESAPRAS